MSLAELVIEGKGDKWGFSFPEPETARKRFEWLRRRNYMVDDVVEGRTTFSAELKKAASNAKCRPWASLKNSEDSRILRYLLTPYSAQTFGSRNSVQLIVPTDYYRYDLVYPSGPKSAAGRIESGVDLLSKAINMICAPIVVTLVAAQITALVLPSATLPIAGTVYALSNAAVAFLKVEEKRARMAYFSEIAQRLDDVVQQLCEPANNSPSESATVRHRLAAQIIRTGDAHYENGRLDDAVAYYIRAVKMEPLDFGQRARLIDTYAVQGNFEEMFAELREARFLFNEQVNEHDTTGTLLYVADSRDNKKLQKDELTAVTVSLLSRTGIAYAMKTVKNASSQTRQASPPS